MPTHARIKRPAKELAAIKRLHSLAPKLHIQANRIEFLCLAFAHGIDAEVRHYKLWDEGWEGLGERQWDDCFEMGDSEEVIAAVVASARAGGYLDAIKTYCNMPGAYERWLSYADRQAALF